MRERPGIILLGICEWSCRWWWW